MLRTFIQFTSITVTFIATCFWLRGAVSLSTRDLAEFASTYVGHNPSILESWAKQKADSIAAGLLLSLSFILQTCNALWPMRICDFEVNGWGVAISLAFSILLCCFCFWGSLRLTKFYLSQVQKL